MTSLAWVKQTWDGQRHWVPINDEIVHELTSDCICGPSEEYHHGTVGAVWRHEGLRKNG